MATGPDDVRFQGETGSHGQTVKMTRMTHNGLAPASLKIEYSARLRADAFGLCNQVKTPETLPPAKTATT
jgi:hypothetical protein